MTTLNDYLAALNNMDAQNQLVKINEEIIRAADPFKKANQSMGLYTEKKTFKLAVPREEEPEHDPHTVQTLENIKALLAQGWVVKDLSFRLEKLNNNS